MPLTKRIALGLLHATVLGEFKVNKNKLYVLLATNTYLTRNAQKNWAGEVRGIKDFFFYATVSFLVIFKEPKIIVIE